MAELDREYQRSLAKGIRPVSVFTGIIPSAPLTFEVGDTFTVPAKFEVLEEVIGEIHNQFILVETQDGEVRRLYPSQLSRRVRAFDLDGAPLGLVTANGSASQLYKQYALVCDGMSALRGRTIKVTKAERVRTMTRDGLFTYKTVYTFDLV